MQRLRAILGVDEVIVGDLTLWQVLQGLENERAARDVEALLRRFEIARWLEKLRLCAFFRADAIGPPIIIPRSSVNWIGYDSNCRARYAISAQ